MVPACMGKAEQRRAIRAANFYADEDAQTSAVYAIADHFHIERSSAYKRKNRALAKFAILLFGKT